MPKLLDLLSLHTKPSVFDGQQNPFVVNFRKDVTGSAGSACWKLRGCVTPRSDTFSLGVTLSLLAGREGETTVSARPGDVRNIALYYYDLTKTMLLMRFLGSVFVFSSVLRTREFSRVTVCCLNVSWGALGGAWRPWSQSSGVRLCRSDLTKGVPGPFFPTGDWAWVTAVDAPRPDPGPPGVPPRVLS